jgi:hypothetical protein
MSSLGGKNSNERVGVPVWMYSEMRMRTPPAVSRACLARTRTDKLGAEGFEPSKRCRNGFTARPLWPLGHTPSPTPSRPKGTTSSSSQPCRFYSSHALRSSRDRGCGTPRPISRRATRHDGRCAVADFTYAVCSRKSNSPSIVAKTNEIEMMKRFGISPPPCASRCKCVPQRDAPGFIVRISRRSQVTRSGSARSVWSGTAC